MFLRTCALRHRQSVGAAVDIRKAAFIIQCHRFLSVSRRRIALCPLTINFRPSCGRVGEQKHLRSNEKNEPSPQAIVFFAQFRVAQHGVGFVHARHGICRRRSGRGVQWLSIMGCGHSDVDQIGVKLQRLLAKRCLHLLQRLIAAKVQ